MTKDELKERFRQFSLRIIKLVNNMPNTIAGNAIAKQIIRSGTSPAANYRAACLAKSDKDFLNKLKMVEEEIKNGKLTTVTLNGFEAPQMTTYLVHKQSYDATRFLENKF